MNSLSYTIESKERWCVGVLRESDMDGLIHSAKAEALHRREYCRQSGAA